MIPDRQTGGRGLLIPKTPTKGEEMENTDATMPATRDEEAEIMGLMTERNIEAQDGGQA